MSDGEPGRMTGPPLSVPKIRFCNNGDEVRRGRDVRSDHGHPCSSDIQFAVLRLSLTEIIKPGHSQQSLSGRARSSSGRFFRPRIVREFCLIPRARMPSRSNAGPAFSRQEFPFCLSLRLDAPRRRRSQLTHSYLDKDIEHCPRSL